MARVPSMAGCPATSGRSWPMWTHPGKKLLFMGSEIGQVGEWGHDREVDWGLLEDGGHAALQRLLGDLNRLYASTPQLHASDNDPNGFAWTVCDDPDDSVFAYERCAIGQEPVLIVLNMTPVPRHAYRVGRTRVHVRV